MASEHGVVVTESDWVASQHRTRRLGWLLTVGGLPVGVIVCLLAMMNAEQYAPGPGQWPVAASLMLLLLLPLAVASQLTNHRQQDRTDHGLIHRADAALSQAKCDGRDRVAIHDSLGKPLLTQSDPAEQSVVDHPRYLRNAIALSRPANRGRPMPDRRRAELDRLPGVHDRPAAALAITATTRA